MVFETIIPLRRRLTGIALLDADEPWPMTPPPRVEVGPPAAPIPAAPPQPTTPASNREEIELLERLTANVEDLCGDLRGQQRQRLEEMQRVAVEIAVAIASRLVHQCIDAGDYAVENLVRQVAERLEPKETLIVYLHPADLMLLEQRTKAGRGSFFTEGNLKLAADERLNRGDCRAETGDMSLVLALDKQLEELRKDLLGTLPDVGVEQRRPQVHERTLRRFPDRRHIA